MNRLTTYKMQMMVFSMFACLLFASHARGQNEAEKTYKAKCVACHAADGSGSDVGKKLGAHDFHSSQVQSESDAELTQIIAKGKGKMPAYEKSLKPDEIKALAAYAKELGGKK
jgi:cytochrome c6